MSGRICFFMDCLQGSGGISRVNWLIITGLSNEKYSLFALGLFDGKEKRYSYPDIIKTDYLFTDQIPNHKRFIKSVIKLRNYIRKNRIDVIVCSGEINFPIVALATIGITVKVVCWEHSNVSVRTEHKFQSLCRYMGTLVADRIVSLTKKDEELYRETYHVNNCIHIYNPIDDRLIKPVLYNTKSKRIISVGRLIYQKNFECAIKVAKKVFQQHPDWTWDIFGEGEDREKLEKMISELGLNNHISLMGQVNDLYDRYPSYSMLVMTSRFEGFPMTLLESIACGIPVIAFDVLTGPNEIIINGKNGYLVDYNDIDTMATYINNLIDSPDLRKQMSDCCQKERSEYTRTRIVGQWYALLDQLS